MQVFDPHLPVFTTHHLDGAGDLLWSGGFDRSIDHHVAVGIDRFPFENTADRFDFRGVYNAGFRVLATGRCQTVDNKINLSPVLLDEIPDFGFDLIRECVPIDVARIESLLFCGVFERDRVVPASSGGTFGSGRSFKEDPDGFRTP
ncbi:MAG: hypothetical protein BWY82_02734 [Verrucomicrobia bacterium ADurb.Bin474]|nr:MAG: hypothetical protein BWY82_02734 [Verrucomicrobia bacterium ADurb.Bin474]